MNKVLYIILISLFSLTIYSCSSSSDDGASTTSTDNTTSSSDDSSDNSTSTSDNSSSYSGSGIFVAVGQYGNIVRSTDNGSSFDNVTSQSNKFTRYLGVHSALLTLWTFVLSELSLSTIQL